MVGHDMRARDTGASVSFRLIGESLSQGFSEGLRIGRQSKMASMLHAQPLRRERRRDDRRPVHGAFDKLQPHAGPGPSGATDTVASS